MTRQRVLRKTAGGLKIRIAALLLVGLVAACSGGKGVYHRVERGQTAYRIARSYGIDTHSLLEENDIDDPRTLQPGQMLWIPGATGSRDVPSMEFPETSSRLTGKRLVMPLDGTISSGFGRRSGRRHQGIDILAPGGTPIRSAGYGVVLYAGNGMRGYGNAIIIDHGDDVTTLYGHLRRIRVKSGDAVAPGGVIGTVGETGNATTTHLHFELRLGGTGVDPKKYLERAGSRR
ncbi:MAG: LysM peptidoglycan-binding domain-containing M23 family metallopeptidase [Candidatus Deferrimicrobiaceae bacterium]